MGSNHIRLGTLGSARRKCQSWIESFIEYSESSPSPKLLRQWAAIATISAALERRVWIETSGVLFPNLYIWLVGKAGIGKSVAIDRATEIAKEIDGFHLSPNTASGAALIDVLADEKTGKRVRDFPAPLETYNTMFVAVDELSNLIHSEDRALVAALTKLYDCSHFKEAKRHDTLRHDIPKPHLSMLCGTTATNLLSSLPNTIWRQGLMSRVILVHTTEKVTTDRLNGYGESSMANLLHDLTYMNKVLYGQITWTAEFRKLQHDWFLDGCPPKVPHPKLESYSDRRHSHMLKLAMIACVDAGGPLVLTKEHFQRAKSWMIEAENTMGDIFMEGSYSIDSQAMDEIVEFVRRQGKPVMQHQLVRQAAQLVPLHSVLRLIDVLYQSGRLKKDHEKNLYLLND